MADREAGSAELQIVGEDEEAEGLPEASEAARAEASEQPADSEANSPPSDDDKEPSPQPDGLLELNSELENSTDDETAPPPQLEANRAGSHSSEDTQPDPAFDPNAIPEVSVRLGVAAPPHLHTNIQVSNHQSTWMNVDPPRSQRPRQPASRVSPEPPAKRMKITVAKNDRKKEASKNPETPKEDKTKGKKGGKKKQVEEEEDEEETYELDHIVTHRYKKKGRKHVIEYKVRWLGYNEDADTWEPESNILGDSAKEMVRIYWEEQKKKGVSKKPTLGKGQKEKAEEVPETVEEPVAEETEAPEPAETEPEPMEVDSAPSSSTPAGEAAHKVGTDWSFEPINKHDWFGIREEDAKSKTAKREFKNLFVADRIPSLSEVLLAGTTGTGRVTRSSLKPLKGEESTPRASKTPEPPRRRRRVTLSPGMAATSSTTTPPTTSDRPSAKRARKSVPAGKSIYAELSSSGSPEGDTVAPAAAPTRSASSPSPGPSTSAAMPRKRASEMGAPPSKSIPKAAAMRKSGPVQPPVTTRLTRQAVSRSRETTTDSPQPSVSEVEHVENIPQQKRKPGIMDSDKKGGRPRVVDEYESSVSPGLVNTHVEDVLSSADEGDDDVVVLDQDGDETLPGEATDADTSGSSWPDVGPDGEILVLTNEHFANLKNVDLAKLFPKKNGADDIDPCEELRFPNYQFDPNTAAKTVEEFYEMAENLDVFKVFATFRMNTMEEQDLNTKDSDGWTLLHRLAQTHCDEDHALCTVLSMVVQQGGCDTSIQDDHGRTALHLAIMATNECAMKRLIELGSPVNTFDVYKKSPLISALETGEKDYVRLLLLSGSSFARVDEYMNNHREDLSEELRDLVISHRDRLCDAMDNARTHIFPQATSGLKKTLLATMLVSPICEKTTIEYQFKLNVLPSAIKNPNNYLLFETALVEMDPIKGDIGVRMWQQSPVKSILINDEEPVFMHKTTNYISMPKLVVGRNHVKIELMNQTYKGTRYCIMTRLAHVFMLGYHRPNRMDPTVGNLMPLTMGNPPNGQARIVAPPAVTQLAVRLRPRYYHDAVVMRPAPPTVQPAVRRFVNPDNRPIAMANRIRPNGFNQQVPTPIGRGVPSTYRVRHVHPTGMISSGMMTTRPQYTTRGLPVRQLPPNMIVRRSSPLPIPTRLQVQRPPSPGVRDSVPHRLANLPSNVIRRQNSPPPSRPMIPGGNFVNTTRTVRAETTPTNPYHSTSPPPGPSNGNSPSTPPDDTASPSARFTPLSNGSRVVPNGFVAYRGDVNRARFMNPRLPLQGQQSVRGVMTRPLTAASNGARPMRIVPGPSSSASSSISTPSTSTSTNSGPPTIAPYHPLSFQPPGRRRQASPPPPAAPAPRSNRPTLEPLIP